VTSTPGAGALFRIRLFLPEVHPGSLGADLPLAQVRRTRRGYQGPRRQILVVDNEEPDRELLVQLLAPLGFVLRTAASGHDALDLLAAGYRPDVVFMDLAMPGIDGWETIRRLRAAGHTHTHVAVVSANAFDKGLENDVGIRPEDFIVKPVRHSELLDWLERRLALHWTESDAVAGPAGKAAVAASTAGFSVPDVVPDAVHLAPLAEVVALGYYRGVLNQLASIETAQPECSAWVNAARALARQFQFEAIARLVEAAVPGVAAGAAPSSPPSPE